MPKKEEEKLNDNLEDEKKEVKKIVDEITKNDPTITDKDYDELLKAVDDIFKQKNSSILVKIGRISLTFVLKYIVMFFITTLVISLFMSHLVIEHVMIFLVAAIISIPLTFIFASQLFGVGSFQKRFLTKFILANVLVITILCLINYYQFRVFKFTADWAGVEIISGLVFMAVDYYLSVAIPFY